MSYLDLYLLSGIFVGIVEVFKRQEIAQEIIARRIKRGMVSPERRLELLINTTIIVTAITPVINTWTMAARIIRILHGR